MQLVITINLRLRCIHRGTLPAALNYDKMLLFSPLPPFLLTRLCGRDPELRGVKVLALSGSLLISESHLNTETLSKLLIPFFLTLFYFNPASL